MLLITLTIVGFRFGNLFFLSVRSDYGSTVALITDMLLYMLPRPTMERLVQVLELFGKKMVGCQFQIAYIQNRPFLKIIFSKY